MPISPVCLIECRWIEKDIGLSCIDRVDMACLGHVCTDSEKKACSVCV
jgi:hypothetical protein